MDLGAFPRVFAGVHDGLCVGEKERRCEDVLFRIISFYRTLLSLGVVGVLDGDGKSSYY